LDTIKPAREEVLSFQKVLEKYRNSSFSERDKGDRFERLMRSYLATDPQFADRFRNVWMWEDFLGHKDFGGRARI
jgi:predicted helicase